MKTILSILVFVLVHECATQEDDSPQCYIWAVDRGGLPPTQNGGSNPNGTLLHALSRGGSQINVSFTGNDTKDPTSVFYIVKRRPPSRQMTLAFGYHSGNSSYYLAVENAGQVKLDRLDGVPTDDKYFFVIKQMRCDVIGLFLTFKSVKTGKYLHCDGKDGRAFMKEGTTEYWQTWMKIRPKNGNSYSDFLDLENFDDTAKSTSE
ncbi:hypothetical protein OS493_000844 [Desmophyllum pertusum]|uniref:Uncharacterized protein n=1 Tax=Desmophyllum pertusum TaxID=174260 RepID=A0A9W9ZT83_9CNID|nr:hypothetical protein OS493_000844 [Desmophyllum pertusum]